jgi:hypothetical protein
MAIASARTPAWFWIVAILFLLWNMMGCWACYSQLTVSAEDFAKLPAAQRDAWQSMTLAPKAAYVVAVAAGLAGAILLLARNAFARPIFIISLIGVLIQFGWFFGVWNGYAKLGPASVGFPVFIALVCVAEIWFAGKAIERGLLR